METVIDVFSLVPDFLSTWCMLMALVIVLMSTSRVNSAKNIKTNWKIMVLHTLVMVCYMTTRIRAIFGWFELKDFHTAECDRIDLEDIAKCWGPELEKGIRHTYMRFGACSFISMLQQFAMLYVFLSYGDKSSSTAGNAALKSHEEKQSGKQSTIK